MTSPPVIVTLGGVPSPPTLAAPAFLNGSAGLPQSLKFTFKSPEGFDTQGFFCLMFFIVCLFAVLVNRDTDL